VHDNILLTERRLHCVFLCYCLCVLWALLPEIKSWWWWWWIP